MISKMLELAKIARGKAYAPYSNFHVGACILSENNNLYSGCNIENAAYPQGWCAECSSISAMIMAGDKIIKEILVIGGNNMICSPCGGCRQKIREFSNLACKIHLATDDGVLKTMLLEDLLPESFGPNNLQKNI